MSPVSGQKDLRNTDHYLVLRKQNKVVVKQNIVVDYSTLFY